MHEMSFWQIMWLHIIDGVVPSVVAAGAWWAIANHRRDMRNGKYDAHVEQSMTRILEKRSKKG